jgi:hypothetical protein
MLQVWSRKKYVMSVRVTKRDVISSLKLCIGLRKHFAGSTSEDKARRFNLLAEELNGLPLGKLATYVSDATLKEHLLVAVQLRTFLMAQMGTEGEEEASELLAQCLVRLPLIRILSDIEAGASNTGGAA